MDDLIYKERANKRRFTKVLALCFVGLLGLLGSLWYLHKMPAEPPCYITTVTHQCVHPSCNQEHSAIHTRSFPDGVGGAVLCAVFFIYCMTIHGVSTAYE